MQFKILVELFIHHLGSYSPSNGNSTRYNTRTIVQIPIVKTPISYLFCLLPLRIMTTLK
jgi:hypothetical protein